MWSDDLRIRSPFVLPPAAIALVRLGPRVLTVARPEPPHEMALPGGTLEAGEIPEQAMTRELLEETGILSESARGVWIGSSPTDGRTVYVFAVDAWSAYPEGKTDDLQVAWLMPAELLAQAQVFGPFLRAMLRQVPM